MNYLLLTDRIAKQRHLVAMRRAFMLNFPLFVVGAFATMLSEVNILWYRQLMAVWFGSSWSAFWHTVSSVCLDGNSLLLVFSVSYFLAKQHVLVRQGQLHPLVSAVVSFSCYMVIMQAGSGGNVRGISFAWSGMEGIFLAVMTGLVATEIFFRCFAVEKIRFELLTEVADPILYQATASLLPAMVTLSCFLAVGLVFDEADLGDIGKILEQFVGNIFLLVQSPWLRMVIYIFFVHVFWFFGLHGSKIMEPFLYYVQLPEGQVLSSLWDVQHQGLPSLTKTFIDTFVLLGGSGSTLCLLVALCLAGRRSSLSYLVKISLLPAVFNINEILVFALPLVLNPIFLLPFLLIPIVLGSMAYAAISLGWVGVVAEGVHWTTPPLLSGYLATHHVSGVVLQLVQIFCGAVLYLPFVYLNERRRTSEIKNAFSVIAQEVSAVKPQESNRFLSRRDEVGTLARALVADIKAALKHHEFFLVYQPQVDSEHRVVGTEALLRWSHPKYGPVPPPVIVAVAEEAGLIQEVGRWVLNSACQQLKQWHSQGLFGIRLSINASALELQSHGFAEEVQAVLEKFDILPSEMEIEITETVALTNDLATNHNLEQLRAFGIHIAIDDFGMGQTSLRYIKDYPVDMLKLDRVLSQDVVNDKNCQEIIASLVSLCASLNIEIIAEYVETKEQRDMLASIGCLHYQGYLYSPPLLPDVFLTYAKFQHS